MFPLLCLDRSTSYPYVVPLGYQRGLPAISATEATRLTYHITPGCAVASLWCQPPVMPALSAIVAFITRLPNTASTATHGRI